MWRDRLLRVVLVLVGLLFLSGVMSLLHFDAPNLAWQQMLASVYATLGLFLLIAAFKPAANRSLIAFTAWSSIVHGCVMALQAWKGAIPRSDFAFAVTPMLVIGVLLLVLAPGASPMPKMQS